MSLAAKITALLEGFSIQQIKGLTPVERRQLANACERVLRDSIHADAAAAKAPKSGVLADLRDNRSRT